MPALGNTSIHCGLISPARPTTQVGHIHDKYL